MDFIQHLNSLPTSIKYMGEFRLELRFKGNFIELGYFYTNGKKIASQYRKEAEIDYLVKAAPIRSEIDFHNGIMKLKNQLSKLEYVNTSENLEKDIIVGAEELRLF